LSLLANNSGFYTELTDEYSEIPAKAAEMNKDMTNYFSIGIMPASFFEFSEKETVHLKDVRCVLQYLNILLLVMLAFFIVTINDFKEKRTILFYGGLISVILPLFFLVLPFDLLFTQMHNVFFAEGSWVFDSSALLVNLYPVNFFFAFAKSIILRGFCLGLVITLLSRK
jgi:integral membrane protein (TIGR01906 family)